MLILLVALTVFYGLAFSKFYFTHDYLPTHDFNVVFISGHIVTNYFINGRFPFWAPEQNSGSPVWPDTEVFPGYDPVSLLVNLVHAARDLNSVYAHVVTVFIWHVIFAGGGFLLFRRMGLGSLSSTFGFAVLLFSSLTLLNFRQADDYVTVYRYVPLLFYVALRFLQENTFRNSVLFGLVAGLSLSGYQTPNIVLLVLFALLASVPLLGRLRRETCLLLVPGLAVAGLMGAPFMVASLSWIRNVAAAREFFPAGYRGGLGDVLGPVAGYFPDETIIYIGFIPLALALIRLGEITVDQFRDRKIKYWPSLYVLVFGLLTWLMHIGFPENFSGVDEPFFYIRSFNNMLPYVLFVLVYFCCEYLDKALGTPREAGEEKGWFYSRPVGIIILIVTGITVFVEFSRPSVISISFNRYTQAPPPKGVLILRNFFEHLSPSHVGVSVFVLAVLAVLLTALAKRRMFAVFACLLTLTVTDLTIANKTLLEQFRGYTSVNNSFRRSNERRPYLSAPLPIEPPRYKQPTLSLTDSTHWFKQGNVIYHIFSARAPILYTWFRTREFDEFVKGIKSKSRFLYLTGVKKETIYFADNVVAVDGPDVLRQLNQLPASDFRDSIVVDRREFPVSMPLVLSPVEDARFGISGFGPNHIKIRTSLSSEAYLVYLDSYAKGWRAYIDGKRTHLIRANHLFKSVLVPGGEHEVEFRYRPYPYIIALAARAAGLLLAVGGLILGGGLGRRLLMRLPVLRERIGGVRGGEGVE
jgi:hypothetical protein